MRELKDRVAVVTGAASGIGFGLASRFAREGAKLVMADVEADALERAADELTRSGADVLAVVTDVSSSAEVEALAAATLDHFGAAHVLCNNAGVATQGEVWEITEAEWTWVLGVNLWGVINGLRSFMPILLKQDEAHVVNTASAAGVVAGAIGSYSVSKHAVVALSEALHFGLARLPDPNVGVTVLIPGFVNTRIYDAERNRPESLGPRTPMSTEERAEREMIRVGLEAGMAPAEVAELVLRAMRDRGFYIYTHPADILPAVEGRFEDLRTGSPPRRLML